jgi:hypothetical protein
MLKVKLTDGSELEVLRDEVHSIIPVTAMLQHPHLTASGLFYHCGKIIPVAGPIDEINENLPAQDRTWILFLGNHAHLIQGFPQFDDDIKLEKKKSNVLNFSTKTETAEELEAESEEPLDPEISEEERVMKEMEELLKTA